MSSNKRIVNTTCKSCHGGCGVFVTVENSRITHIEGDPNSPTEGTMCPKGLASIQDVYNPNRIRYPMKRLGKRGEGKWERISWEEALTTITEKMKELRKMRKTELKTRKENHEKMAKQS